MTEGFAGSLPEAATRFAISHPAMGTILVGMATVDEFEAGLAAVQKGPLPVAALARLAGLRGGFVGEGRGRPTPGVPPRSMLKVLISRRLLYGEM